MNSFQSRRSTKATWAACMPYLRFTRSQKFLIFFLNLNPQCNVRCAIGALKNYHTHTKFKSCAATDIFNSWKFFKHVKWRIITNDNKLTKLLFDIPRR